MLFEATSDLDLICAESLSKGLEMLQDLEHPVDALLLDLCLPDSHGFDSFSRVIEAKPSIPIIIITGISDEETAIRAVREGAQDYLVKGQLNGQVLLNSIRYAIERKGIVEELHRVRAEVETRIEEKTAELRRANKTLMEEISARREFEEELRKSKERYQTLVESVNDIVWEIDNKFVYTYVNSKVRDILGYEPYEIIGKTPYDLMPPEEVRKAEQRINDIINSGGSIVAFENINIHKNGRRVILETSGGPIFNDRGKIVGYRGIDRDITIRKKAQEALLFDEIRLESLFKISQHKAESTQELLDYALEEAISLTKSKIGYIYHYDEKTKIFTLNTWSKDVMKECSIQEKKTHYHLEKTGLWGEAVRQRIPIVLNDFEVPNTMKKGYPEGHAPLLRFMTVPVIVSEKILAVVGVANKEDPYDQPDVRQLTLLMDAVWNIVERREAEETLKKLSVAIEQSPSSIVITDKDGRIEYVNPKFKELTGYTLEEALGQNPRILKTGRTTKAEYQTLWEAILSGCEWKGEFYNKKKNGEHFWEQATIAPVKDSAGEIVSFIAVKEDITARKKAEEEIARYQRFLENLSMTDGLTGIANRRRFDEFLEREWRRAMRASSPISLVLMDIDFFKGYNDHYGHLAGDDCLRRVAQGLTTVVRRPTDLVARYGGEEFGCLLPDTEIGGALWIARQIMSAVENLNIPHAVSSVAGYVTLSIGVATLVPNGGQGSHELISEADTLLYRAKQGGRNRIEATAGSPGQDVQEATPLMQPKAGHDGE